MSKSLMESFLIVVDPRIDRRLKHELVDVLVLAVCGILSGCNQWTEIEDYANEKVDFFKTILNLKNGIPSHDTFGRIFSILDPESFQNAFFEWAAGLREKMGCEIINIDGKFLNGSMRESGRSRSAIALVSAWASEAGVFLGQTKSELKKEEGEKRATEELLDLLYLKGCIVTLDANGATPRITEKIVNKGADYLIGLKLNQKALLNFAKRIFEENLQKPDFSTEEKGHGRIEVREYWQANLDGKGCQKLSELYRALRRKWPTLKSFVKVTSSRTIRERTKTETRYYFSSASGDTEALARAVRSHWAVENNLHWILDVVFKEDESRVRMKHAAENFGLLRRMTLNILKHFQDPKGRKLSINRKRNHCNWNDSYLLKTLYDAKAF
jgi:predicted transposase YbfD/YdcC